MEYTNFMFVVALVFLFMSGAFMYWGDMSTRYSYTPTFTSAFNQSLINESFSSMYELTNSSYTQAGTSTGASDTFWGAAMGYVSGALSALKTMIAIPNIMMKMTSAVQQGLGIFLPSYFTGVLIFGIWAVALIGVLYYLLKVK
jgi:hypothetical protein